ncbi:O-antigen ligase family protein [Nostoc sp. PA-18-2419]|uniref:O-antigen ligase family protein n=1 Tax=Nostoc sp. PA-18-2419 TaxID=2575443 RepID=UPI00110975FE|nr:O-antigen ligase family protein [Nostoc sp. PA-18-2419]
MLTNQSSSSVLTLWISLVGVGIGLVVGFLAGIQPVYLGLAVGAILVVFLFFARFEQVVLALLILRTALDPFSAHQIPAAFAIGVDVLTLLYVAVMLLTGRTVHTDRFWWFFAGWVMLQGLWVILLPLGGLGFDASFLPDSIREWVRIFSWLMVYLLVMQLKDRLHPEKIISGLFLALIIPLTVAFMQIFMRSVLPPILSINTVEDLVSASRIKGTIGHANGFVTLLLLFIGLTCWKLGQSKQRWLWFILLSLLIFFYVSTKALFGLIMLATFSLVLIIPRLSLISCINAVLFIAVVLGIFASSEFGRERLASLTSTPLLNPDMDISRAILLSQGDGNSFNWRLAHWYLLLNLTQQYPLLGYGLGLSLQAGGGVYLPHNDYIRALTEGGIIGLLTFLVFLIVQGARLVQLIRTTSPSSSQYKLCSILLAIFVSMPVAMITENIWSHTTLFFYWFTLFAIVGWNWNNLPPAKNTPPAKTTVL